MSAASVRDIPVAVTYNGRPEVPRSTGMAMGSGPEGGLGHADHRDGEFGASVGTQTGLTIRIQVGVAVDDQQGHLAQPVQYGAHRWEFAQVESAGPVRRNVRYQFGALGY